MIFFAQTGEVGLTVGPFWLLALAIPVLLLGEGLVRRVTWLRRANIPAAIIGGAIVAVSLLVVAEVRPGWLVVQGNTANPWWLWPVMPQWGLTVPRATDVERPLLILFFTCVGVNASWRTAKQGGGPLLVFLGLGAGIAALQAVCGVAVALGLGQSALLGLMASTVTLMGGFGTAAGFAPEFESAGLAGASTIGVAAAAFGVIAAGIGAGLLGGRLVEKKVGRTEVAATETTGAALTAKVQRTFFGEGRELVRGGRSTVLHLAALLTCMKLGAFVSAFIQGMGVTFPVYIGALIVAAILRNTHDALGGTWLKTEQADRIGSVALMGLLAVVMVDLQLSQLMHAALPMLIILATQVLLTGAVVYWLVFRVMGRDYEAAVMSAGMFGFGLGATSNALATMRVLTQRFGAAPRAFLIVPIVGAFLIDFANALVITTALNFLK